MRILSWNINGIRTLPQYHPWNTLKTGEAILAELDADIICFQGEYTLLVVKANTLDRHFVLPGSYDSFFSFPTGKGKTGYSGVAVYANKVPLKAEEGLTGIIQPKPPLCPDERISASYPQAHEMDEILMPDEQTDTSTNLAPLDSEGRSLVLDFGLFVLINVYCPNETSDARLPFKMNFHHMLCERVRTLVEKEHREVIVIGDINICATPKDHCDGHLPSNATCFYDHPARAWFRNWLNPQGPMTDIVRTFWPDRLGMYTCWNQKISARDSNYGTRVDYILVTKGLLPWIKHGDILPSLKGSDHCPIYVDLHDEITSADGASISLRQAMKLDSEAIRDPPRLASKYWDEYSGKQTMLSTFFGKRTVVSPDSSVLPAPQSAEDPTPSPPEPASTPSNGTSSLKRKESIPTPATTSPKPAKKPRNKTGQTKLSTFFSSSSQPSSSNISSSTSSFTLKGTLLSSATPTSSPEAENSGPNYTVARTSTIDAGQQLEADYQFACQLASSQPPPQPSKSLKHHRSTSSSTLATTSKSTWSNLLAPLAPPKCVVHNEPAKELTVNKPGPNKGKKFFVCSRPVGPGYDRGRSERLREEVNPEFKCNFFKWASEVKREALKSPPLNT